MPEALLSYGKPLTFKFLPLQPVQTTWRRDGEDYNHLTNQQELRVFERGSRDSDEVTEPGAVRGQHPGNKHTFVAGCRSSGMSRTALLKCWDSRPSAFYTCAFLVDTYSRSEPRPEHQLLWNPAHAPTFHISGSVPSSPQHFCTPVPISSCQDNS